MPFEFEKLEVWKLALDYVDGVYEVAERLPTDERYNLTSQMTRAATSVALNIAEGSTGQTDREQAHFLGHAIRSLLETVACQHLISRRGYLADPAPLRDLYRKSERLAKKLQAFRNTIAPNKPWLREPSASYLTRDDHELRF
jgi:four helix bundle protein